MSYPGKAGTQHGATSTVDRRNHPTSWARSVLLCVVLLLALLAWSMPAEGRTPSVKPGSSRLLWGAWIGDQFTGSEAPWDWRAVTDFEASNADGENLKVVHWSSPWRNPSTGSAYRFARSAFERVLRHGVISFVSWANSGISDADVAAGLWDRYI